MTVNIFVWYCTKRYGKAKIILHQNQFYVESEYLNVQRELLRDSQIN